ncbi:PilZ domain-containing protein [Sphingomonas sp. QA11]|uniref:PilZ domain-containing protein n=1 Tax=Sphingomonas sp. QA11 TaxID=2950605 RepID=UPI00234B2042|nr:PilZ domain-containing protein [Sphingomonas sp. QA11]WCM28821.1 PilZ domain-containing protein [Sphingomonas sp. QA11]
MGLESHPFQEKRVDERIPVFHRTRATGPDGQALSLVIVDLSANGLMARCDAQLAPGEWLQIMLPLIGTCRARLRWSLGGRIGCEFDQPIGPEQYGELLAMLVSQAEVMR